MNSINDNKVQLNYGIHKGTLMSRDTNSREFESLDEAKKYLDEEERFIKGFGYMIWFAYIKMSDGKEYSIHPGNSYI